MFNSPEVRRIMRPISPEALAVFGHRQRRPSPGIRHRAADSSLWDVIAKMRYNDASVALVTSKDGQFVPLTFKA